MTIALALFGNQSFFNAASNTINSSTARSALFSIWQFDALPFIRLDLTGFNTAGDSCNEFQWRLDNYDNVDMY